MLMKFFTRIKNDNVKFYMD